MKRRAKKGRRGVFGWVLEVLADIVLLLIILAFGISIAAHVGKSERSPKAGAASGENAADSPGAQRETQAGALPSAHEPTRAREDALRRGAVDEARSRPTVDVRNGCPRVGLAADIARQMRGARFDVLEYRTADRYDYEKTLIKERGNQGAAASAVRDWFRKEYGVGRIQKDPSLTTAAEVLIILGADLADTLRHRERSTR